MPGIRELLVQSEEDIAAGRVCGEAEALAYLADMSAELTAADADCASGTALSGEGMPCRYSACRIAEFRPVTSQSIPLS